MLFNDALIMGSVAPTDNHDPTNNYIVDTKYELMLAVI